jgi:hypothetical protein
VVKHGADIRTIVVGDVHGCLDELLALLAKCGATADDAVVLVGDLVAKGPDSQGVVQWARESGARAVLGNHDAHVLRAHSGDPAAKGQHLKVAAALDDAGIAWLQERPLWIRLSLASPHVVVHGGLVPTCAASPTTVSRRSTSNGPPGRRRGRAPNTSSSATTPCAASSDIASRPASTPAASTAGSSPRWCCPSTTWFRCPRCVPTRVRNQ